MDPSKEMGVGREEGKEGNSNFHFKKLINLNNGEVIKAQDSPAGGWFVHSKSLHQDSLEQVSSACNTERPYLGTFCIFPSAGRYLSSIHVYYFRK